MSDIQKTKFTNSNGDNLIILPDTDSANNGDVLTVTKSGQTASIVWAEGGGTTDISIDKCIFVDPENGLDTNSGLTEDKPVATVAQAYTLMELNNFDTFCVIGTEPNDPQANPIVVEIPAVPNTLVIDTLNIVTKVSSQLTFASINTALNINAKSSVLKVFYGGTVTSNINITSDGNVEMHNTEYDVESTTSNLKINAKGDVFLNCVPYDDGDYGCYPDSSADYYDFYAQSVNVKANNVYACGCVKNGCDINFIADNDVYNLLELAYGESVEDDNWSNITQNYYFDAGNSVCQLKDAVANTFIVKSKYYGYCDGSTVVTGSLTIKSKVDIRTTNDTYIGSIEIGDITERGRVYIAGGFEQCVSDKAQFDQQGKSLNNPILQINGIISHYSTTASRNLHEYAPVVFIDWKGLIEHNGTAIFAQQYKEKSLGYTTNSVLSGLYISGLDYFRNIDGEDSPIYHNYPVEIYSEGTLRNLKIYTGIDDASQKWVPVHIKCKNLVADGVEICSHDIVIDAEDSIISSGQATYFLPKPGNYYETDNGYIASYISTDTDTESSVIVRAKRNITFIPPTLDENYTCNQVFTVEAGEEVRLNNFGNFGTRICAKTINIKAHKLSGNFDNFCAEFHVDVDEFETLGSYFKVYGYLGANDKWAHLGTTQSTFNAKTVIMLNDTTEEEPKPIAGIFEFGMISSNPTEVRNLDIHIGTIVCSFDWKGGIYCPLLRSCSDYNGEISGEIGTIVNTYNGKIHKITRWQKDLIFSQPDNILYWNTGARVSLHFADRSSPSDIFVDPDQGDDRFDGLTASRPVKTAIGLYRALKAQDYITIDNSNHYIRIGKPITLHMLSGLSGNNRGSGSIPSSDNYSLKLYVNRGMTGDTDLQESYTYEFWFGSDLEIVPEAPNLRVAFQYLNSNYSIIEARGFESFYVDGYAGSVLIVEAANVIRINNNMSGPVTTYSTRWNSGYNTFKSREIELVGLFYNIVADADYQFSIYDTTGTYPYSTGNCCINGYTKIHSVYNIYLGNSNSPVGINGIASIKSDLYISAYLDTILGELNMDAGSGITGSIGSGFMKSRLRMRSKAITFLNGSFAGTTNMGNLADYPGNYIDIEAEQSISSSGTSTIPFYKCDVNIKTKYLNSPQIYLYGDQNSKSVIEAEVITPSIRYRFGNVTIKATHASNYISREAGGPIAVPGSYAENLYLDINEFEGYIYLPYESGQYNYISRVFARIGTTYQPAINWGFNPADPQTPAVAYSLSVTVEHSKFNPSGSATKKSNYGDIIPANAYGEILILNDMEVEIPQPQVVNKTAVIPSGTTVAGVELENDNYNVIATIPAEATELDVHFPESTNKVQESGFQFDVEANSQLALVKAFVAGRRLPVNAPSTFTNGKIYQGSSVNGIVVVAEFEPFNIVLSSIQTDNLTASSVDVVLTGTNIENNLEYDLVLTSENGERTVHAIGSTYTLASADFTFYDSATDLAATVIIGGVNYGSYALKGFPPIFDGRLYKFVKIGNQTWLAENLDYKFPGLSMNNQSDSTTAKQGDYYDYDEVTYGVNGNKFGILYNWPALKYLDDNKSTLIPGWRVPTETDYDTLITYAGGSSVAGDKLKSTSDWTNDSPSTTNSLKFSAKPAGYALNSFNTQQLEFGSVGTINYLNTITKYSSNPDYQVVQYYLSSGNSSITKIQNGRNNEYSVRLIRNI